MRLRLVHGFVVAAVLFTGLRPASAVPAFSRKYKTSCVTCHTIFPKLNPFGEQFRRNGFRFPGIDSDAVKSEPVPLGAEQTKQMFPEQVWPGFLSSFPPLAIGFNGQAIMHPDKNSGGGAADNNSVFNLDTLVEEAHLWAAGSIDDSITFFSELTFSSDGVEVENAALYFNDLAGPAHALNVAVGKRFGTVTSFGPHSTYFADLPLPGVPVTGLYGATSDPFVFNDNHTGIEVNGVIGMFDYSAGLAAGTNLDVRNSANLYAHAGYKIGGATLDGENTNNVPQDLEHEHAVTLDAFIYRSISRFSDPTMALTKDTSLVLGGTARLQWDKFELDAGAFYQTDDHVLDGAPKTSTLSQWNEIAYLVYPWLVVGGRIELLNVSPEGGTAVHDFRIVPGVAALIRPNIKLTLTGSLEQASGAPDAGWGAAGLAAAPADPTGSVGIEIEQVQLQIFAAF
jgi:thiol-disulfide isomerase/thioredoxin